MELTREYVKTAFRGHYTYPDTCASILRALVVRCKAVIGELTHIIYDDTEPEVLPTLGEVSAAVLDGEALLALMEDIPDE